MILSKTCIFYSCNCFVAALEQCRAVPQNCISMVLRMLTGLYSRQGEACKISASFSRALPSKTLPQSTMSDCGASY